ncbi:unnamed protein product [Rotaria magnacalcarata]|uniref:Uncharacterized protein n=1 Tax=Rotaria magnacalcarata TaxID=392030 RepID=A0A816Z413_9BILA|nr:unnamed protein product [Rotaria magnacalcarata]CAF2175675.1 unnamed protein product [Rotaria magnacalcarata]CAF4027908.1 unnamed protein product [Rotaria magnacalcarata]CAF4133167.1 unnamed protein product [Rotaria magnacalcarata]CAF4776921.1 unnamed protein product [Rotaria magnacalcarata]
MSPKVTIRNAWTTNEQENPSKCQKVPTIEAKSFSGTLVEVDSLQQVRWRIFLHWSHRISPSSTQMIEAGYFNCNVDDRLICIYCNPICQQ